MVKIIGNLETSGNIQSSGLSQKFTFEQLCKLGVLK